MIVYLDYSGFRYLEQKCFIEHVKVTDMLYKLCENNCPIHYKLVNLVKDYIKSEGNNYCIKIERVYQNMLNYYPIAFRLVKIVK